MNCQEFEVDIDSQARGALADSRVRAEAAAHEESCAACASRLADERALTSGLRALASGMGGEEAPARVEARLLAAFRAGVGRGAPEDEGEPVPAPAVSTAAASSLVVPPRNVLSLTRRADVKGWSWAKTLAVASLAAAAAVALFTLAPQFASAPAQKRSEVAGNQGGRHSTNGTASSTGGNTSTDTQPDREQIASSRDDVSGPSRMTGSIEITTPRAASPRRPSTPARATNASYVDGGRHEASAAAGEAAGAQDGSEIATDFIPLVQAAHLGQADGGYVIRVEMPSAALASFGLPVNMERAGGRVKADVLLGDDGIARAIRFVR